MPRRVLFVVYRRGWASNRLTDLLRRRGVDVEPRCPRLGDPLPDTPGAYDGIVVGGGLDSVNAADSKPYIAAIRDLVRREVDAGTPYLGMCLGAQMLASAYGGRVWAREDGLGQVGYHGLTPTGIGKETFGGLGAALFCHVEGLTAPPGAEVLATGERFPTLAFRLDRHAYGVQFHPEVTPGRLPGFLRDVRREVRLPDDRPTAQQVAEGVRRDPSVHTWLSGFLDHWLGGER